MLRDCAAEAVIVGHSERRQYHQENPALIRKKIDCVLQQGLKVIFCIGEKAEERAAHQTLKVLFEQCGSSLMDFKYQENMIIAYEPIWSIGTGKLPSLEEIEEVYQALKDFLPSLIGGIPPILYGGSVTAAFAQSLSKSALVDGFLVGKASLNPKEFYQISTFLR
jgi:triosephosphate isomerase